MSVEIRLDDQTYIFLSLFIIVNLAANEKLI